MAAVAPGRWEHGWRPRTSRRPEEKAPKDSASLGAPSGRRRGHPEVNAPRKPRVCSVLRVEKRGSLDPAGRLEVRVYARLPRALDTSPAATADPAPWPSPAPAVLSTEPVVLPKGVAAAAASAGPTRGLWHASRSWAAGRGPRWWTTRSFSLARPSSACGPQARLLRVWFLPRSPLGVGSANPGGCVGLGVPVCGALRKAGGVASGVWVQDEGDPRARAPPATHLWGQCLQRTRRCALGGLANGPESPTFHRGRRAQERHNGGRPGPSGHLAVPAVTSAIPWSPRRHSPVGLG